MEGRREEHNEDSYNNYKYDDKDKIQTNTNTNVNTNDSRSTNIKNTITNLFEQYVYRCNAVHTHTTTIHIWEAVQ